MPPWARARTPCSWMLEEQNSNLALWNPRQSLPNAAREIRIVVGSASAFVDSSIHKELPIPGPRRADVLDVEPDVRSAIARELVIPLRSFVELVGALKVIEKQGSSPFRCRRNQAIEIDVFKAVIGAQPHGCRARR